MLSLRYLSLLTAFGMGLLVSGQQAFATVWNVNAGRSRIGFEVLQSGSMLKGTFGTWNAAIDFNPDDLANSTIQATIITGSVKTSDKQIASTLEGTDWFNIGQFPEAVFKTTRITRVSDGTYRAEGTLSMKGISLPVSFPFTLDLEGTKAYAKAEVVLLRKNFQLGKDVPNGAVADNVTVDIEIFATR
ncbi:YceI family protein [Flexibacterium corallicola]|uniref:YceI family protein n=1 Tax=Flexibacterium corallicola TaxID=3037259 RepID=UPI00286F9735|nr:YceI family protein [Pseudovibrio sp. M1P-2-3]